MLPARVEPLSRARAPVDPRVYLIWAHGRCAPLGDGFGSPVLFDKESLRNDEGVKALFACQRILCIHAVVLRRPIYKRLILLYFSELKKAGNPESFQNLS